MTASAHPRRFRRLPTAEVTSLRVPVAVTFLSRLLGLALLRPGRAGAGLLIPRCRSVHTFGMRFSLDVVFLDRDRRPTTTSCRRPISVSHGVPANRLVGHPAADAVLELPRGGAP